MVPMSPTHRTTVQIPVSYLRRTVAALAAADKASDRYHRAGDAYVNSLALVGYSDSAELRASAERATEAMLDVRAVALSTSRQLLRVMLSSAELDLEALVNAHNVGELDTLLAASIRAEAAE